MYIHFLLLEPIIYHIRLRGYEQVHRMHPFKSAAVIAIRFIDAESIGRDAKCVNLSGIVWKIMKEIDILVKGELNLHI